MRNPPLPVQAVILACTLPVVHLLAQPVSPNRSRLIPVTVIDPANRFVTGLEQDNFVVIENGVARPIIYFAGVESPITIAIVGDSPLALDPKLIRSGDEIVQSSTLSEARGQLIAAKNQRKAIIVTNAADVQGFPAGIQVLRANPENWSKAVIELRNQYLLRVETAEPGTNLEIALKVPRGLPALKPVWKNSF